MLDEDAHEQRFAGRVDPLPARHAAAAIRLVASNIDVTMVCFTVQPALFYQRACRRQSIEVMDLPHTRRDITRLSTHSLLERGFRAHCDRLQIWRCTRQIAPRHRSPRADHACRTPCGTGPCTTR